MWALIELCVIAAIILVAITEFFIPLLFNKPLFGSFRKTTPPQPADAPPENLTDKLVQTKQKVEAIKEEVKEVRSQADENYKNAETLKDESDNLL